EIDGEAFAGARAFRAGMELDVAIGEEQRWFAHFGPQGEGACEPRTGALEPALEFRFQGLQKAAEIEDASHRIAGGRVALAEVGGLAPGRARDGAFVRVRDENPVYTAVSLLPLFLCPGPAGRQDGLR